jgi:hypothetical protein
MKVRFLFLSALLFSSVLIARSQPKEEVPKALLNARYVYVEALDGDIYSTNLIPEDRVAIVDTEDAMRNWNRYSVTLRRTDAEIVVVVRKGRTASAKVGGTIGRGNIPGTSEPENREAGRVGAEIGPKEDLLSVYLVKPDGKRMGPIWKQYLKDGLDKPEMPLFKQFRDAVDAAAKAPAKQSTP